MIRTPKKITGDVQIFCREISTCHKPEYVQVVPEKDAQINECFFNVEQKIERDGGAALNGWLIWIWPSVFIEAEHHCVWENENGDHVDVTPKQHGESKIVFLPDPEKSYDDEQNRRLDNVRKALTKDSCVAEFLRLAAEKNRMIEDSTIEGSRMVSLDPQKIGDIVDRLANLEAKMIQKFIRPNDPCPCRNGKKYKRCHGLR